MAVDIDTIGISVDTRDVKSASRDLDQFGKSADKASRDADKFGKNAKGGFDNAASSILNFSKVIGVAYTAYAGFARFVDTADTFKKLSSQLKLATNGQEEYNKALSDVSRIANAAQTDIEAVSKLYARLSGSLAELGVNQQQIATVSETVALALKASGAQASEAASVMLQLSQAFGSGVLRGDEFNSMAENSPILMRALAQSMGVTTGALRDMASEGQITRDVLLKAFGDTSLLENLRKQAEEVTTVGGAWQSLKNEIILLVGELDQAIGLSDKLAKSLGGVATMLGKDSPVRSFFDFNRRLLDAAKYGLGFETSIDKANKASRRAVASKGGIFQSASPITYGANIAPNFGATIEVQDVNKIHKAQEEVARNQKRISNALDKDREAARKKAAEHERELANQESAFKARLMSDEMERYRKQAEEKTKEEKERIEKLMDWQQKIANENFREAQRLQQEQIEKAQRQYEQMAREVSQAFTNGLFDSFKRGEKFGRAMVRNIVALAQTWFARMFENLLTGGGNVFAKLFGSVASLFTGNAVASESGGGISGIFSSIKDAFGTGNGSIIGAIENLGSIIANGNGGLLDSIGGFIGANSSAIANGFGYLGAGLQLAQGNITGALGTAVGTFFGGPVGGAIGSLLGGALGGLFGGRPKTRKFSTGAAGVFSNGQFSSTAQSGLAGYGRALGGGDTLAKVMEEYSKLVSGFFNAFGLDGDVNTQASLFQRSSSKTRAWGYFNAQAGGGSTNIGQPAPFGSADAALNDLVERIFSQGIAEVIQSSNIAAGVKKFFDELTSREQILDAVQTLASLNAQLQVLPPVFNAIKNAIDTTAYSTSIEQLKAQFAATQTFVNLFYSDAEKFGIFTDQLNAQLEAINQTLPSSRDAYRALVESINVVDEATRDQFNSLVSLAPAMNEYFNLLEQQAGGINEVNQALAESLDKNLFSTYADYVTAQSLATTGQNYTGMIGDLATRQQVQGDSSLLAEVQTLKQQQADTKTVMEAIAIYMNDMNKTIQRWNGDGMPEVRVI
jgi:tape measure domain-containing protein